MHNQGREYDHEVISLRVAFRKDQEDVEKLEGRSLANYSFDGLFTDWAVGDKISQPQSSVSSTKSQINRMLDKLSSMESAADREVTKLKTQLDDLIVKS